MTGADRKHSATTLPMKICIRCALGRQLLRRSRFDLLHQMSRCAGPQMGNQEMAVIGDRGGRCANSIRKFDELKGKALGFFPRALGRGDVGRIAFGQFHRPLALSRQRGFRSALKKAWGPWAIEREARRALGTLGYGPRPLASANGLPSRTCQMCVPLDARRTFR